MDLQSELKPDIVASVTDLPLADNSVDVSLCCQVLEHLPFDLFAVAMKELARVATLGVVLSLPDARPHYEIRLRLPKLGSFKWAGTRPYHVPKKRRDAVWESSGHYWEVGYRETPLTRVLGVLRANGLTVTRTWRVSENPYHRFFVLRVSR